MRGLASPTPTGQDIGRISAVRDNHAKATVGALD